MSLPPIDRYLDRTPTGRMKQLIREIEFHLDVAGQVGEMDSLARGVISVKSAGTPDLADEPLKALTVLAHLLHDHELILIRSRNAYREHCRIEILRRKTRGRISQRREELGRQLEGLMAQIEEFIRSFRQTCDRWGIRFECGFPIVTVALNPPDPGENSREAMRGILEGGAGNC
jgi:hypothetical protein